MTSFDDTQREPSRMNEGADFWFYDIETNVIPANTKEKITFENWSHWQDQCISNELHESRKEKGEYANGIAVMTGRIGKGRNEGKYLIGIDCDNKKAIEEICTKDGKSITLEDLAKWTIVEQHKDNLNKAHIYILSTKPFKNKGRDPNKVEAESLNEIPAIEIKCEKRIMFCSPSIHENGYPYEILGTKEPALCDEFEIHLDNIFKQYGIEYLDNHEQPRHNNNNNSLPQPLRQLIEMLEIPSNFQYRILEGVRHSTMLSFANSLLIKYSNKISKENLQNFFIKVNDTLCSPPLPQNEIMSIWQSALEFSQKVMEGFTGINNNKDDHNNYNKPIIVSLQIDGTF